MTVIANIGAASLGSSYSVSTGTGNADTFSQSLLGSLADICDSKFAVPRSEVRGAGPTPLSGSGQQSSPAASGVGVPGYGTQNSRPLKNTSATLSDPVLSALSAAISASTPLPQVQPVLDVQVSATSIQSAAQNASRSNLPCEALPPALIPSADVIPLRTSIESAGFIAATATNIEAAALQVPGLSSLRDVSRLASCGDAADPTAQAGPSPQEVPVDQTESGVGENVSSDKQADAFSSQFLAEGQDVNRLCIQSSGITPQADASDMGEKSVSSKPLGATATLGAMPSAQAVFTDKRRSLSADTGACSPAQGHVKAQQPVQMGSGDADGNNGSNPTPSTQRSAKSVQESSLPAQKPTKLTHSDTGGAEKTNLTKPLAQAVAPTTLCEDTIYSVFHGVAENSVALNQSVAQNSQLAALLHSAVVHAPGMHPVSGPTLPQLRSLSSTRPARVNAPSASSHPAAESMHVEEQDADSDHSSNNDPDPKPTAPETASPGSPSVLVIPVTASDPRSNPRSTPDMQVTKSNTSDSSVPESAHAIQAAGQVTSATIPSPVQLARLAENAAQSEMQIGLSTSAFGNVHVRTVVHASDVGVVIGVEKGDLRSWLAHDLPGITHNLQQQDLRIQVSFQQSGLSTSADSSGQNAQSGPFTFKQSAGGRTEPPVRESESVPDAPTETRSGLSILA